MFACFNRPMQGDPSARPSVRMTVTTACRSTRLAMGMTLRTLAEAVGVTPSHIWAIEHGQANPSLDLVVRLARALDLELEVTLRPPIIHGDRRQIDLVHAWVSGYVDRRFSTSGWNTAREVEIIHGRSHGWIDLLAFDRTSGTLLVIEIKTRLDDLGAIERQLGWYERSAMAAARELGWLPRRTISWLLLLATEESDWRLRQNRDAIAAGFRGRQPDMLRLLANPAAQWRSGHGIAMVDPASRRRDWLIRPRLDGRRSAAPYLDYRSAASTLVKA